VSYFLLKWEGKKLWFRGWSAIGPRFTDKRSEAQKFDTREDAMHHPAFYHPASLVEVREYQERKARRHGST
jgi:hypothetical protein